MCTMKFRVDPIAITSESPFSGDAFSRKAFAHSLENVLQESGGRIVVAIDAVWGDGKTTFAKMWEQSLLQRSEKPVSIIYIDAFATDFEEDPFVSFCGEISELAKKALKSDRSIREKLAKYAGGIGKISAIGGKVIARRLLEAGATDKGAQELIAVGNELIDEGADSLGELVSEKVRNYGRERSKRAKFESVVKELAAKITEKQGGFPLTVVVDELDRCRPDYALKLLERIKHYFDVDNVAFVLMLNIEELSHTIEATYGIKQPDLYLNKFVHVRTAFPHDETVEFQNGMRLFVSRLFDQFLVGPGDRDSWMENMIYSIQIIRPSLREIERAIMSLVLTIVGFKIQGAYGYRGGGRPVLLCFMACVREKDRPFYQRIAKGEIDYEAVVERFGIVENEDAGYFFDLLKVGFAGSRENVVKPGGDVDERLEDLLRFIQSPPKGPLISMTCRDFLDRFQIS